MTIFFNSLNVLITFLNLAEYRLNNYTHILLRHIIIHDIDSLNIIVIITGK